MNQKGFTLIEIMIAMVIAAIGLLGLFGMHGNAIKGNISGSKHTQATFLAQNMVERIKEGSTVGEGTFGFVDMSNTLPGIVKETGEKAGVDESCNLGGSFHIKWQVADHTDWSRRVEVTVSWPGVFGQTREVTLKSISRGEGN